MQNNSRRESGPLQVVGDLMTKKRRSCLIVQNLVIQILILAVFYIFGPPAFEMIEGSASCYRNDDSVAHLGYCKSIDPVTQQWWAATVTDLKPGNQFLVFRVQPIVRSPPLISDATMTETMTYSVAVYKLRPGAAGGPVNGDTAEELVTSSIDNRTVECSPSSCSNFTAARFRIEEAGDYYVRLDWQFDSSLLPFSRLEFSAVTMDYGNAVATGLVKIFLLVYTILDFGCYCCNLRRAKLLAAEKGSRFELSFEQKFLVALNVAMLLFFDPIGIAHAFSPTVFTYVWTSLWNATFLSMLVYFWLVMFARIVYEKEDLQTKYNRPWIWIVTFAYFLLLFITPLLLVKSIKNNPGFSVSQEYPNGYYATLILANTLFLVFTVYVFVCSFLALRSWKALMVRHKAFFVATASFYLIFLIATCAALYFRGTRGVLLVELMILVFLVVSSYNHVYSFAKPVNKPGARMNATTANADASAELRRLPADDAALDDAVYSGEMNLMPQVNDDFGDVFMPDNKEKEQSDKELGARIKLKQRPGRQQASDKYKEDSGEESSKKTPGKDTDSPFKWE